MLVFHFVILSLCLVMTFSFHQTYPCTVDAVKKRSSMKQNLSPMFLSQNESPDNINTKSSTPEINDNGEINNDNVDDTDAWYENLDVLLEDGDDLYEGDTAADWISDAEKSNQRRPRGNHELIPAKEVLGGNNKNSDESTDNNTQQHNKKRPSPYTEEEENLIAAMGGKDKKKQGVKPREIGFLGDSNLRDISTDYSVPICYLADVLVQWGVDVPINVYDRLGDLVTGEQAFALVEAVNTLDVGHLNDRYSNQNLLQICDEWEIEIKDAFEFVMKEGWSLPFGVRTNLRVEQEDELLRVFSSLYREVDDD